MFIDADTHVDECADTWSYFPSSMRDLKPLQMVFEEGEQPGYRQDTGRNIQGLLVDGQLFGRNIRSDEGTETTLGTRSLTDVPTRIRHMDERGVGVQVIYPTILLREMTRRPELESAICESYNRWIGDRCADSRGRLRWAAVLPLRSIPDALREMRRAKEEGAVAIFKRGYECDERNASDPYFAPIYSLAQELDLPICVHTSAPCTAYSTGYPSKLQRELPTFFYVQDAFFSVVRDRTLDKFPNLRFGFIEAAAGWVPHMLWSAGFDPRLVSMGESPGVNFVPPRERDRIEEFLSDRRIFVTCEEAESVPDLIDQIGNRSLMLGSDYSHPDRASIHHVLQRVYDSKDISRESAERLTHDNAKRLYGLG